MANKYNEFLEQPSRDQSWRVALYIRLSKEDNEKGESYSVTSQREILLEYLKTHPEFELFDIYVDDGWSGTNFDRPDFKRMMDDVYEGKVNCIIVKDLSRFGRNYAETANFTENIFVRLKIRFIALNNAIDSFSDDMNSATKCITMGVQNVINESVAATTSVNIRGTLNVSRKQGKFIGSFACYGYKKDPADKHKLIIDEEAADVVRMIYKLFLEGKGILGIVKQLNALGIPNPAAYKKQQGLNYNHTSGVNNDGLWCDQTVRRILKNEMYIGNMVQGKNTTISYKIKQCRPVPKSDWIIVENTHEPIIDKDTFYKVQSLFKMDSFVRKSLLTDNVDLFSGLVKCADCGRAMSKKTNTFDYGTYSYYRCVTNNKKGMCFTHSIRIDKLEQAVLYTIKAMIKTALELEAFLMEVEERAKNNPETDIIQRTIDKKTEEIERYKKMSLSLYPDWKSGAITKEEYSQLKENIAEKIRELDGMVAELKKQRGNPENKNPKQNEFINHFLQYATIDKLTRPIVVELIDSILVHGNGNITINFKFKDAYEEAIEYIDEVKRLMLAEIA
ncbi:MAG: recombinase family protein [Eubacterium sp.]|nr:recombinase family protein [Eubacterium sp.]